MLLESPIKIDSPIKKWPILNSLIPFNLDSIFADLKVRPWPACTSKPISFPSLVAFLIFNNSFEKSLLSFIRLHNFPVWISTQSAPNILDNFIS